MSFIGQYRILGELASGGMGTVLLGEHRLLGRRAAIKTLLPMLSAQPELVERFFTEARATSAIADPGVVQIYDFGYHVDGTAYIVMELLDGESLAERLVRRGRLSIAEALRIARQCAGSLAAAHARDIVHRDLKPDNIYLVRDPEASGGERPKLLDFGICKLRGERSGTQTRTGTTFGTPAYMSPEQCRGAGELDTRSDIYALGCVLFQMLTGRPPFADDAPGEIMVSHLRDDPPAPSTIVPELWPELDELVLRCLAKAPCDRFASMVVVQAAIAPLEARAVAASPSRPTAAVSVPPLPAPALGSPPPIDASTWDLPVVRSRRRLAPFALAFLAAGFVAAAGWVYSDGTSVPAAAAVAAPIDAGTDGMQIDAAIDAAPVLPPLVDGGIDAPILRDKPEAAAPKTRRPVRVHRAAAVAAPEDLYETR